MQNSFHNAQQIVDYIDRSGDAMNSRIFQQFVFFLLRGLVFAGLLAPIGETASSQPLEIGTQNQIFIDGRFLAQQDHVRIVVQPPRKTGEMQFVTAPYLQVMENDGVFKYFSLVSNDGSKWEKPTQKRLDEGEFRYGIYWSMPERPFGVVFKDPHAPREERYKVVSGFQNRVFATADGSEWKTLQLNIFPQQISFPRGMDSQNAVFFDDKYGCYVAYVRANMQHEPPPQYREYFKNSRFHNGNNHLRCVRRCTSQDLVTFTEGEIVLAPDAHDPIMDGVGVGDFYMPQVIKYPHAQDAYVMFPNRYLHYQQWYLGEDLRHLPTAKPDEVLNDGPIDIGFAASRDGIQWERYARKPLIPLGRKGQFDWGGLYPVRGLIVKGDEMWLYYVAFGDHGMPLPIEGHESEGVLSRAIFRKDGFTALEADYPRGEFTTPVLRFEGHSLHLNVETSALGLIRVEIQDEEGEPLPGFALEDCDRMHSTNRTDALVKWRKGQSDLSSLAGKPLRLRFELMYGAKLYAFRAQADSPEVSSTNLSAQESPPES